MAKIKLISIALFFYTSTSLAQASHQCLHIFINDSSNVLNLANKKTEVQSLETLGKAMTEGMLLHPEQADIFEIYRQVFFGDPKTSLNGQNLKAVTEILKKYPDLIKKHFREFEIRAIEKVYKTPEALDRFIRSQITTAGQIRNNLFQIEANISF